MNKREEMSLEEIHNKGLDALHKELGLVGTIRFIQICSKGSGDYTRDRHKWLPEGDVETIVKEIIARRKKREEGKKS